MELSPCMQEPIMATDTAPQVGMPTSHRTHFWQLPTFAVGLASLILAVKFVPQPPAMADADMRESLAALTAAVEKRPPDLVAIGSLTEFLAPVPGEHPALASQIHYAVGSGYRVLALYGPFEQAEDNWRKADSHFSQCQATDLPSEDVAKRFAFRSAEANAAIGSNDPKAVIFALSQLPSEEDTSDTHRLIALTALRMDPPDLARARDELTRYLSLPTRLPVEVLGRYKLQLAELHFTLEQPDAARRWLKDIGQNATPEVLARSKVHLARLAMGESNWSEAAKLLESAQAVAGIPADQQGWLRYQTGYAFLQMGNPRQAVAYLEQAAREKSPVGPAAAIRLAELRVMDAAQQGNRSDVVDWLDQAVSKVSDVSELKAVDLTSLELQTIFENVIRRVADEGDFESAVRAATAYAHVADDAKDRERRAEVYARWAEKLEGTNEKIVRAKHLAAGRDFAAVAEANPMGLNKSDWLRKAISHYRKGGANDDALKLAESMLKMADLPANDRAQAWLVKAELLPPSETQAITEALNQAMATHSIAGTKARLRLALQHLQHGSLLQQNADAKTKTQAETMIRLGRDLLVQIADATDITNEERTVHEEAIFQLGSRLMKEGHYDDAETRFRKQLQLYPQAKLSDFGKLWLACCLVQQGHNGGPGDPRLQEAITLLEPLLNAKEDFIRTQAEIRTLNTLVVQERYDAVLKLGDRLLHQYRGKADELVIGKLMFYSFLQRRPAEPGEALRVLLRMEELHKSLPADAYPNDLEYSQARWERELQAMRQELDRRKE